MRKRERGEGQFGCIVGLALLLVAVFVALKVIPVKAKMADLRQTIVDEAKSAGNRNDVQITKTILAKAEEQQLPVTEDDIHINRTQSSITVDVDYTVPVVFPGYTYQWHQHHNVSNPIF